MNEWVCFDVGERWRDRGWKRFIMQRERGKGSIRERKRGKGGREEGRVWACCIRVRVSSWLVGLLVDNGGLVDEERVLVS